ncbi:phosphoribosylamine--glycine ligase [candidate division KSB1 bacterium]|nr:phosphoribosylamine--glycine ligase [candidate division KSB1 bacterium]
MKILVIGGGGREHTLVWKLNQSPNVDKIYCAPGNAGIAQIAECVNISDTDVDALVQFADRNRIDLTVVGPEAGLVAGVVDAFQAQGLTIFGPSQKAAELEGSKIFAKYVMDKYKVPTASYKTFTDADAAKAHIKASPAPIVVKADGLAAGKGAIVCQTTDAALKAIDMIMVDRSFGEAGNKVVIEECLKGEEASVLAISDGINFIPLVAAQDHKPIFDNDEGPNTGGMGAYAPAVLVNDDMMKTVCKTVIAPMIKGMALEGRPYRGVLYAGLMITKQGPKVIEFNCRFGDPEAQAIIPLLDCDLAELLLASCNGTLDTFEVKTSPKTAVAVVMSSGGYPGEYQKGKIIFGLENITEDNVTVFHAGTKTNNGRIVTNGGRVLAVAAVSDTVDAAISDAYHAVGKITWDGAYYRKDIAYKALKR